MALVIADRVKVTSTTTGTGTFTLGSAVTGFRDFGVIGDANTTYYTITANGGSDWEVGIGTYTAAGTTLSRDTILSSSNSGLAVNFAAGTKDVFVTYPSNRSVVSYEGNNSEFASTTRMVFAQGTAPTGWTKDTSNYNNHALRVVTGAASTGGTVDFVTAFASQTPSGNVSTTVTASTGQTAQAGNISSSGSTGQVAQAGNVSSSGSTGQVAQAGNISVSTGNSTVPVSIGNTTVSGNVSVSTGNAASPNGNTTLSTPVIPSHTHGIQAAASPGMTGGVFNITNSFWPTSAGPYGTARGIASATGGSGAHTHPAGNHVHPASATFSGAQHVHPASGGNHLHPASGTFTGSQHAHPVTVTSNFTGSQHAHPVTVTSTFTGSQHNHPVSAPASSSFTGNAINLAVKYLDVITATKD